MPKNFSGQVVSLITIPSVFGDYIVSNLPALKLMMKDNIHNYRWDAMVLMHWAVIDALRLLAIAPLVEAEIGRE